MHWIKRINKLDNDQNPYQHKSQLHNISQKYAYIVCFGRVVKSWYLVDSFIHLQSSLRYKQNQIHKLKCFLPRLAFVFAQSIEARC